MAYNKTSVSPRIDTSPPILFVDNVLRSTKLVHDIRRQREIAKANKELLKRINQINRTKVKNYFVVFNEKYCFTLQSVGVSWCELRIQGQKILELGSTCTRSQKNTAG